MACKNCEERRAKLREAVIQGKLLQAAGHAVAGVKEMLSGVDRDGPAKVGAGNEAKADGGSKNSRAKPSSGDDKDGS